MSTNEQFKRAKNKTRKRFSLIQQYSTKSQTEILAIFVTIYAMINHLNFKHQTQVAHTFLIIIFFNQHTVPFFWCCCCCASVTLMTAGCLTGEAFITSCSLGSTTSSQPGTLLSLMASHRGDSCLQARLSSILSSI